MSALNFKIEKKLDYGPGLGRAGIISTPHGDIHTPAFITVGTKATVKALTSKQLREEVNPEAALANTYHLFLQPGEEVVKEAGGLHKFMDWSGPIVTDSGGFQVMSLGLGFANNLNKFASQEDLQKSSQEGEKRQCRAEQPAKVDEEGVSFRSHIDGSEQRLTPEKSIAIQHDLGADIILAFDELPSVDTSEDYQREAMERTHRWAGRCLDYHQSKENKEHQALYGIVQGGMSKELRQEAARTIGEMAFDGFGIGGSYTKETMPDMLRWVNEILPVEKPRHLLGIGAEPLDFFIGVENGADTFDCVAPTRMARNATLYTRHGRLNMRNSALQTDHGLIDDTCDCYTCTHHSRAYLAHLFRAKEMLAATLATIHNLHFIVSLVRNIRQSILDDTYEQYRAEVLGDYYK